MYSLFIKIAYFLIYYYSCFEIQVNNLLKFINPYIKAVKKFLIFIKLMSQPIAKKTVLEFYDNGKSIIDYTCDIAYKDFEFNDFIIRSASIFDLVIISDYSSTDNNMPINKICIHDNPHTFNYELSDIKFMSLHFYQKNKIYNIILKNDEYNYYIVNNLIDKRFLKYYCSKVLNVNICTLTDMESILIKKDGYEIKFREIIEETQSNNSELKKWL